MAEVAGKREKVGRSQIGFDFCLDLFAKLLMGIAVCSAIVAIFLTFLWFVTSWYTPYENYKESIVFVTKDGQYLRVEYPKRILANSTSATLTLTLRGKIDAVKSVEIELPSEVRPLGFQDSASKRTVSLDFSVIGSELPQTVSLTILHSKTVNGIGWYRNIIILISSKDLFPGPIPVKLQMETVTWATIREFVNNSVNDKSPLILLMSGLISWAGTYLLQYIKDKREQQKEKQQEKREKKELIKKNNDELWSGLKSDPIPTIKNFVDQVEEEEESNGQEVALEEFRNDFMVLKLNDWKNPLFKQIVVYWHDGDTDRANQLIRVVNYLETFFLLEIQEDTEALSQLNTLMLKGKAVLQSSEADAIIIAYEYWGMPIKSILQMAVLKYLLVPNNITVIADSYTKKPDLWDRILKTFDINFLLNNLLKPLLEKEKNYELSEEEEKQKIALVTLTSASSPYWRPLWQNTVRRVSPKIYNWLKQYNADVKRVPFGAEFAELDVDFDFYKVEHTVFNQVGYPISSIVFGEKGSGKTATAYILMKNCQISNNAVGIGAFPIYCGFDDSIDGRIWLVESVSRALIDFISDNPERFLMADASRRLAMGKLMLANTGTVNKLRNSFDKIVFGVSEDREEILKQVADMEVFRFGKKIKNAEVLDLLRLAIPDGFDRTYFLMDVSERHLLKHAAAVIKDFSDLSLQLARQGFFFKVFAPIEIRPELGDISMFEQLELLWDDSQLQNILERRFERFNAFCDRKVKKPSEFLIKASLKSPRRLIHYGNSLIQYAEANLSELEKLPLEAFLEIFSAGSEDRNR